MVNLIISKEKLESTEKIRRIIKYVNENKEGLVQGLTIIHLNKEDSERDVEIDNIIKYELLTFILYVAKSMGTSRVVREGFEFEKIREHYGTILVGSAVFNVSATARGIIHINVSRAPILDSTRFLTRYLKGEIVEYSIPGAFIFAVSFHERVSRGICENLRMLLSEHGIPVLGECMISSPDVRETYALVLYLLDPSLLEQHPILRVVRPLWEEKIELLSEYIKEGFIEALESLETVLKTVISEKRVSEEKLGSLRNKFHNLRNMAKILITLEGDGEIEYYITKFEFIAEVISKISKIVKLEEEMKRRERRIKTLRIKLMILKLEGKKEEADKLKGYISKELESLKEIENEIKSTWNDLGDALGTSDMSDRKP